MRIQLLTLLLLLPVASALQIEAVYYDAHNEAGSEFIIIKNTGNQVIDLTGYKISTPSSSNDATLSGMILPGSTYLITDAGWESGKDNSSWPQADHSETLTLPNSDGFVSIVDVFETTLDTVGYGNTDTYMQTPHPGTQEGEALVRIGNTGNNSADFEPQKPFSQIQIQGSRTTTINVSVDNIAPTIDQVRVDGIVAQQQIELITGQKTIQIEVDVTDNNTLQGVSVSVNGANLTSSDTGVSGIFVGEINVNALTENLSVTVSDAELSKTQIIEIIWASAVSLEIPSSITSNLKPGQTVVEELSIQNTGSTALDFQIQGTKPRLLDVVLGSVRYQIAGQTFDLAEDFRMHPVGLGAGEELQISLNMTAGFVPSGTYSGQVVIVGVAN